MMEVVLLNLLDSRHESGKMLYAPSDIDNLNVGKMGGGKRTQNSWVGLGKSDIRSLRLLPVHTYT